MHLAGTTLSLRDLARRWKTLEDKVKHLNAHIDALATSAAPTLIQLHGVGTEVAGQFLSIIAIIRTRRGEPTRAHIERRTTESLNNHEIIHRLKRLITREIYTNPPQTAAQQT